MIHFNLLNTPSLIMQSVEKLIADPGVMSLIPAQSQTFVEIDNEIISMAILLSHRFKKGWCQLFDCLFVLLLYVLSQQLWSLRDGQFT